MSSKRRSSSINPNAISNIPTEILFLILRYLDDGEVCRYRKTMEFCNYMSVEKQWCTTAREVLHRTVFITNNKCPCSASSCEVLHPPNLRPLLQTIKKHNTYSKIKNLYAAIDFNGGEQSEVEEFKHVISSLQQLQQVQITLYFSFPLSASTFDPLSYPLKAIFCLLKEISKKSESLRLFALHKEFLAYSQAKS